MATLEKAHGYQGDAMNLPVQDIAAALPFYETVLGFRVPSRSDAPYKSAVLARDEVQIGLASACVRWTSMCGRSMIIAEGAIALDAKVERSRQ